MEMLYKIMMMIHIAAGVTTLLLGPVAIFFNEKNIRAHRFAGKTFFYAMNIVCISSVVSFFINPSKIFNQFLLGIAILVYAGILRGVRSIQLMKGDTVKRFDFVYSILLLIFGLGMLGRGGYNWWSGGHIAFTILFTVFGIGSLIDAIKNLRIFSKPLMMKKLDWFSLHVSSMIGAFIASSTAFTVNVAAVLPWYLQWFGPTLLLLPLQFYFAKKIKGRMKLQTAV